MVPRKPRIQKLDVPDSVATDPLSMLPVAEPFDTPEGKRIADQVWRVITSKLLTRIRTANAAVDARVAVPVTVVIPAWLRNEQDVTWLLEALESVLAQTVSCKTIIVENGSEFLPDFAGVVSILHSEKGLSIARNAGIRASDTDFFFPLDCNDWLPDTAIETLYTKRPAKGFLYGSTMLFNHARGMGDQHLYDAKPYDFSEVMKMVYFPNGALQRKADWEAIGGYRESLPFLEDWDYWMTAGELGICGTAILDVVYWYRQHGGIVMTHNKTTEWEQVKKLIQSYHKDIYRGAYPPMCCGNKTTVTKHPYVPQSVELLTPGADGMLLIEYLGGNAGKMPYYGAITGTRYTVGGAQKRLYIDVSDAITGSKSNPGFLEIVDHGNPLFKQVEA